MKKITIILLLFTLYATNQSCAQEYDQRINPNSPIGLEEEAVRHNRQRPEVRKLHIRRAKAQRNKIRAMRRVAQADGVITPNERAIIKGEKQRMKRNNVRIRRNARRSKDCIPNPRHRS